MSKIGFSVFVVALTGAILILVIGGVPRSKGKTGNPPNVQTMGLPAYGVAIVGPNEARFTNLMSKALRERSTVNAVPLNGASVFIVNDSGKSISALSVRWELRQADGRIVVHHQGHRSTLRVVSDGDSARLEQDIPPNNSRLLSLDDGSSDANKGFRINMGGGGVDKSRQLSECVSVTISVDGVLFEDGAFVGPDTRGFFESLNAELETRHEVFGEIVRGLNGDSEAMKHIEALANYDHKSMQALKEQGDPSLDDRMAKANYASMMLAMRKELGDKATLERINAELSKPRISLRRL